MTQTGEETPTGPAPLLDDAAVGEFWEALKKKEPNQRVKLAFVTIPQSKFEEEEWVAWSGSKCSGHGALRLQFDHEKAETPISWFEGKIKGFTGMAFTQHPPQEHGEFDPKDEQEQREKRRIEYEALRAENISLRTALSNPSSAPSTGLKELADAITGSKTSHTTAICGIKFPTAPQVGISAFYAFLWKGKPLEWKMAIKEHFDNGGVQRVRSIIGRVDFEQTKRMFELLMEDGLQLETKNQLRLAQHVLEAMLRLYVFATMGGPAVELFQTHVDDQWCKQSINYGDIMIELSKKFKSSLTQPQDSQTGQFPLQQPSEVQLIAPQFGRGSPQQIQSTPQQFGRGVFPPQFQNRRAFRGRGFRGPV